MYKVTVIDEFWTRDEQEDGCVHGFVRLVKTLEEVAQLVQDMNEPACFSPNVRVEVCAGSWGVGKTNPCLGL